MERARSITEFLRRASLELTGAPSDFDALLEIVGDARIVLIGEASHGTHDFYRVRAEITKRLIREKGFDAVALEADWPDANRVHRYVLGRGDDADADEALAGFERFPQWMWRNADMLDFVGWLRQWNDARPERERAGIYGLDLYSLHRSMDAVLAYLRIVDPEAAQRAQKRYACFEDFGADPQSYGYAATLGLKGNCEVEVLEQLVELQRSAYEYSSRDGRIAAGDQFFAEQNARLVVNAERYYRTMFAGHAASWNARDRHMAETLKAIDAYLTVDLGRRAKLVVWAHNSHVGDARATDRARAGELNIGQLARQRYGAAAACLGFTTYAGTVTAASDWDAPAERKVVRDALAGSWEYELHALGGANVLLDWRRVGATTLGARRLERAIGVIYRPETERVSHYFEADLHAQFDAVLHYDRTRAVEPLERRAPRAPGEVPETYPSAL